MTVTDDCLIKVLITYKFSMFTEHASSFQSYSNSKYSTPALFPNVQLVFNTKHFLAYFECNAIDLSIPILFYKSPLKSLLLCLYGNELVKIMCSELHL